MSKHANDSRGGYGAGHDDGLLVEEVPSFLDRRRLGSYGDRAR